MESIRVLKDKISKLEDAGFNWFEIAYMLDMTYTTVRDISEGDYD